MLSSTSWPRSWKIGLPENFFTEWELYHSQLGEASVSLSQKMDRLVWDGYMVKGCINVKESYSYISMNIFPFLVAD